MTTWAYSNKLLAVDTKATNGKEKTAFKVEKLRVRQINGVWCAIAGAGALNGVNAMTDWICSGMKWWRKPVKKYDASVILATPEYARIFSLFNKTSDFISEVPDFAATGGSGKDIATYHLEYRNCNAIEAVVKACKYDAGTDWPIHFWMPGMQEYGVITKKDWKRNKQKYRKIGARK